MQVGAFSDYTPGAAPAAAAEEPEEPPAQEEEDAPAAEEDRGGGGGGGGGDYPPHSVMGLPALSPTMSQGALGGSRATRSLPSAPPGASEPA